MFGKDQTFQGGHNTNRHVVQKELEMQSCPDSLPHNLQFAFIECIACHIQFRCLFSTIQAFIECIPSSLMHFRWCNSGGH
jgi:hypothetical protein